MTTIDTNVYKQKLEEMLTAIITELENLGIHNPDVETDWIATVEAITTEADPNDVADRAEDYVERRSTLAALETRYNNLKRALGKIEAGTYGVCEIAHEAIESDRLDANPAARTCKAHIEEESNLEK